MRMHFEDVSPWWVSGCCNLDVCSGVWVGHAVRNILARAGYRSGSDFGYLWRKSVRRKMVASVSLERVAYGTIPLEAQLCLRLKQAVSLWVGGLEECRSFRIVFMKCIGPWPHGTPINFVIAFCRDVNNPSIVFRMFYSFLIFVSFKTIFQNYRSLWNVLVQSRLRPKLVVSIRGLVQ